MPNRLFHMYMQLLLIFFSLSQTCILMLPADFRPKSSAVEKEKSHSTLAALDNAVNVGTKARKKDKLPKHSIQQTDGAKYMSYVKVSYSRHLSLYLVHLDAVNHQAAINWLSKIY